MQKATVAYSIYIFDNSPRDERWMMKLQHLQTIQTCHCHRMPGKYMGKWHHDMPQHSAILRSPIPHTRPWRPRHQSCWNSNGCSWRTSLSSAPRPRPGNRDRSRLASSSRALPFKSWSLKSGEHMTFNSDMLISLIQNLANNAESDSCLQHLHIWQPSLNRDEWWNYRTSKPSKLVTVKGCRKHMKTETFSGGLYRQNLITEILRTNICKYEKNTFNSNMWISLMRNLANNGNQPRNPHFHSPSTCSKKSPGSTMNDETPAPPKPSKIVTVTGCRESMGKWHHDMPQHSAEPIPHTRPWRPRHQSCWNSNGCSWRTSLSSAPRPRPGNGDRARLASSYRSNRDHWNPENTWHIMTFIWDILADTKFERTIQRSTISFRIYHVERCHSNIQFIVTKLNVGTWILGSSMRKVLACQKCFGYWVEPS